MSGGTRRPLGRKPARVAIVGAGPAGISAARELIKSGVAVTLFDKETASGGLKRYGYPSFRMPSSISEREAAQLAEQGVEFKGEAELGRTLQLADLERGYAAVLLATGAPVPSRLGIAGEDLPGVYDAPRYLYGSRTERPLPAGPRVLVVGGGDTAVDAATTALFLGADEALILVRRGEEGLAAQPHEIKYARDKGAAFRFWSVPTKIEPGATADGAAVMADGAAVMAAGTAGVPAGRTYGSLEVPGSLEVTIATTQLAGEPPVLAMTSQVSTERFDTVIVAIGQSRHLTFLQSLGLEVADDGTTNRPGVFVAGGTLYGSQRLAKAIIDGRRAAQQIAGYLDGPA